jgi:hypothetical protein
MLSRIPYWLMYLLGIGAFYIYSLFHGTGGPIGATLKVTDAAKATLDLVLELSKMATTLNTALYAGAASLAIKGKDWSTTWTRLDGTLIVLTLLAGAISYYGVYLGHVAVLDMLQASYVNPLAPRLQFAIELQYQGTLLGLFLLGVVFVRMLEHHSAPQPNTALK